MISNEFIINRTNINNKIINDFWLKKVNFNCTIVKKPLYKIKSYIKIKKYNKG